MNARERNRADFPHAAQRMDELREVFGEGVRLVWAMEGSKAVGKRNEGGYQVSGDEMVLRADSEAVIKKGRYGK